MNISIHSAITRLLCSALVFLGMSGIVLPHVMDSHPPLFIEALLWPVTLIGPSIGRALPHPNIGTPERPVYEGTPLDLLVGMGLILLCLLMYALITFVVLTLISKILKRRQRIPENRV